MPQRGAGKAAKAQAATRQSRSCSAEDCRQDPRAPPVPSLRGPRHTELQGAPRAQRAVPWCQKAAASPRSVPPSKGRPGTLQPTPHISHPACNGTKTPPRTKTPPTKRALRYLGQEIPAAPAVWLGAHRPLPRQTHPSHTGSRLLRAHGATGCHRAPSASSPAPPGSSDSPGFWGSCSLK